jgi:hypothetical protein
MSKNTDLSSLINYVKGATSGRLTFPSYVSTTSFTGTVAGYLAFDSSGNILTTTSPTTQWTTSGSNIFYNTGNVGINNSSPAYKLDVVGDINITGSFRINGTPIGTGGGGGISGSGTTNFLTKWSGSTSVTNSIAFDNGSDFAIGTSTPLYKFTIQPFTNINFGIGRTTLFSSDDTIFVNAVNNTYGATPMIINASHLSFYIGFSEAMRITSSKLVLINTVSGVSGGGQLQVNGDVNITGTFKVNGVAIGTGGGGTGNINGSGAVGYFPLFSGTTTISTGNIAGTTLGDANEYASIITNSSGVNRGNITFTSTATSQVLQIRAYSYITSAVCKLQLNATQVIFTGGMKAEFLPLNDFGLVDGEFYRDVNGFVKMKVTS